MTVPQNENPYPNIKNPEIVYLIDGPMVQHRKVIERGDNEVVFVELESGSYVRTDETVATEAGFRYKA